MSIIVVIILLLFGYFTAEPETVAVPRPVAIQPVVAIAEPVETPSGPATALAVDPVSGEAIYAVAGDALLRADGDGGWEATGTAPGLETTIIDSRNHDALWAGSGQQCYRGGGGTTPLMHSTDAGATWVEAGPAGYVPLASWDPGDTALAHDCAGLQVSRDGGATWAMPEGLPQGSQVTAFAVLSTPDSAAGLRVLVGVTGEGGTSELYRVGLSDPTMPAVDGPLATWWGHAPVAVTDEGAILIGAPQGVLRSADDGRTWETLRAGLESTTLERDPIEFFPSDLEPGTFGLTAFATPGEEVYVAGVDGAYHLSGERWEKVAELDAEVTTLATEPGTGALLAGTSEPDVLRIEVAAGA